MDTNKIRVLIVSQQVLFRQGLEIVFSAMKDTEISGTTDFSNGIAFALDESPPDVAIIDIDGPSDSSLILARRMKQRLPSIGVVMLTSKPNDAQLFQALKAQAAAYLSKEITADHLANVIRRVARGEHPINESLTTHPNVADQVLKQFQELSSQSESEDFISPLTARETEILDYIAKGYLNKQIALILSVSEQTIKNHVTSVLRKLNANARTEAVVVGIKKGLISIA
ncbi:MAG TPA: response regulator transcription factor [Dehalococcoidia bacterium]|nr:response regulator transcription factor [Dehalococcoidia bacterium]